MLFSPIGNIYSKFIHKEPDASGHLLSIIQILLFTATGRNVLVQINPANSDKPPELVVRDHAALYQATHMLSVRPEFLRVG